jgi:hypothetical protein
VSAVLRQRRPDCSGGRQSETSGFPVAIPREGQCEEASRSAPDTPVIVEAAAYHDGIVIVQVNQIVGLWTVPLLHYCVTLRGDFEHEHDDQFDALAEWLALELVPSGIDHLAYLNYLLQHTKQPISLITT